MVTYKNTKYKAWLALAPMLALMALFTFWPIINTVIMAFLNRFIFLGRLDIYASEGYTGTYLSGIHRGIGIENFIDVFSDPKFWKALKNTILMVVVSVPLTVIIGLLIAVGLNSIKKLQGTFQTIFFLPYVTNTIALGLVFMALFNTNYGLINTIFGIKTEWLTQNASWGKTFLVLMIYTVWNGLAFKILVFLSGLQSIDKQYYQAAQIDSASKWRVFSRITVPLLSPMILYITITSFIGAFKVYSSVISLYGQGSDYYGKDDQMITVVGYVYRQLWGTEGTNFGKASAGALILFAIILLITIVQLQVSKKRVHY